MQDFLKTLLAVIVGVAMIAGAAAGWKFWQIDGFLAALLGAAGITLIGAAFGKDIL
jgi:hypothetical protein